MNVLQEQAAAFRQVKEDRAAEARQCAAFFLISGIDLAEAMKLRGKEKAALLARLGRLIERERLKGVRQHWSYDLNRHIALKQAYDRLKCSDAQHPAEWRSNGRVSPASKGKRRYPRRAVRSGKTESSHSGKRN